MWSRSPGPVRPPVRSSRSSPATCMQLSDWLKAVGGTTIAMSRPGLRCQCSNPRGPGLRCVAGERSRRPRTVQSQTDVETPSGCSSSTSIGLLEDNAREGGGKRREVSLLFPLTRLLFALFRALVLRHRERVVNTRLAHSIHAEGAHALMNVQRPHAVTTHRGGLNEDPPSKKGLWGEA